MQMFRFLLFSVALGLYLSVCAFADTGVEMDSKPTGLVTGTVNDTLGVGTEGYGSPVESDRIRSAEIYSSRPGFFHPFLSVGGFYTDNLFNSSDQEQSDWVTVITPGIWVARPASRQRMVDINTINTAPGGLALSRFETESERRLQTYALYRADIREHDKYNDENRIDHRAEGMIKLSLRGGMSLELVDVFEVNRDSYGTGGTPGRQLDKFTSNLFRASLGYRLSPKLRLRLDYGNYYLDYNKDLNSYRNREDNSLDAYVFYRLTPKTSVYLQSEFIWIDYDEDINSDSDSDEMNYYIGAQMKTSAKTRGLIKLGYGNKSYDHPGLKDRNEWLVEVQMDYFFTPKTSLYIKGLRRVHETDTLGATDILTHRVQIGYRQRFSPKFRGEAAAYFMNNEYDGLVTIDSVTGKRDDDRVGFVAALGFSPRTWLNFSLGYEYEDRDSNFNSEDYTTNTVFFRVTAAL